MTDFHTEPDMWEVIVVEAAGLTGVCVYTQWDKLCCLLVFGVSLETKKKKASFWTHMYIFADID